VTNARRDRTAARPRGERRRAAALARHYHDQEGLPIAEVARRLGRAEATIKAYLYDPSDAHKGPSWEREAEPGGRELRSHPPAAASQGDVLPRRTCSAFGWLSSTVGRLGVLMLDRVTERRRAAQLARHYRDREGLSIAEVARRLGRAEATIKSYLYDPTGDKAREVKARYRGVCRGCGAPTAPRNGKGDAYAYCKRCHPGAIAPEWTRERVREAMRAWRARYGAAPSSYDWSRTHAHRRGGEALKRLQAGEWPAPSTVIDLYGAWAKALADAFSGT
jgi:DNA-binding CsgD family transcriptional regulator